METTKERPANIIIVDDEASARSVLLRALEAAIDGTMSYEIHEFEEAADAIIFASASSVDIAFLDIHMREMTGVELASELKKFNAMVNIIFTTGYSEYMPDAISLHASGYIRKPVRCEKVKKELDNLLYPIDFAREGAHHRAYAKTFGNFDFFVDGKNVKFALSKSKELLAYLIDRRGAAVSRKEIATVIFEGREYDIRLQSYITKVITSLNNALKENGCPDILISERNSYAVDLSKFKCDTEDYLSGDPTARAQYLGEYMMQYSWAENSVGMFSNDW